MLLDPHPDPFAVAVEQDRSQEEAQAAGNDREQREQGNVIARETRGDGHELVWDWRQPLEQDYQRAPLRVLDAKSLDLVAETIEMDQPLPDGIIEQRADRVAEHAADHGRRG